MSLMARALFALKGPALEALDLECHVDEHRRVSFGAERQREFGFYERGAGTSSELISPSRLDPGPR
jgi:hypothetical protein